MLAVGIRKQLQQFGNRDIDTVVAWTGTRVGRLHLAIFSGFEGFFVFFLFLALDLVLAVDRGQQEVDGFADETFTRGGGRGDAGHKGETVLLLVEVLKTYAGRECAEDGQGSDDHGGAEAFGYAAADEVKNARQGRECQNALCFGLEGRRLFVGHSSGGDGAVEEFGHVAFAGTIDG